MSFSPEPSLKFSGILLRFTIVRLLPVQDKDCHLHLQSLFTRSSYSFYKLVILLYYTVAIVILEILYWRISVRIYFSVFIILIWPVLGSFSFSSTYIIYSAKNPHTKISNKIAFEIPKAVFSPTFPLVQEQKVVPRDKPLTIQQQKVKILLNRKLQTRETLRSPHSTGCFD